MNRLLISPRNCSSICRVRIDRRLPNQHAGDEGTENCVDADQMRDHGHDAHQEQDNRDGRGRTNEVVVCPADQAEDQPPPDGKADGKEGEGTQQRLGDGSRQYRPTEYQRLVELGWLTATSPNISDVGYQATDKGRAAAVANGHD